MIKGITEQEENIIKGILREVPYRFYYYGSRVKGDFKKNSDLDILIDADRELKFSEIENLELKFNLSLIPYKVNFCERIKIDKNFYNLIKDSLVEISF